MNETNEVIKGLREGLESGLLKAAGVEGLTEEQRQFVDLTVENFEKTAGWSEFLNGGKAGFSSEVGKAVAQTSVPLLGGLGVAAGLGAIRMIANGANRSKFEAALKLAVSRNPILQHADQERVKSLGDTIYATAPNVATDPNILGQVLQNAIRGDQNIDIQTVKMLAELESRRTPSQTLTARNFSL